MYIPPAFREDDTTALHGLIRQHPFGILVTRDAGSSFASHLPFLIEEDGGLGVLRAHVARGNGQWRDLAEQSEVLVIFHGPHAYVSPSWYETKPSVPTWNYVAVHAYGAPRLLEGPETHERLLRDLVREFESGFESPWPFDLPADYTAGMIRAIVGFEIRITRLEGKLKLGQNRSPADRQGAAAGLMGTGSRWMHGLGR